MAAAAPAPAPMRIIVDTDIGIDDASALILALTCRHCTVEAVTCVSGNTSVDNAFVNAHRVLELTGHVEVPVLRGAEAPLLPWLAPPTWIGHGADGLGDAGLPLPACLGAGKARACVGEVAANAIVRIVRANPHQIHLVCLGPLTNVALAISLCPQLPELLAGMVVMGGAHMGMGNASLSGEFNFHGDAEAAAIVLAKYKTCGKYVTMVSWEQTVALSFSWVDFDQWLRGADSATPIASFVKSVCSKYEQLCRKHVPSAATTPAATAADTIPGCANCACALSRGFPEWVLCDVVAMAAALDPAVVKDSMMLDCYVETGNGMCRGATVFDWYRNKQHAYPFTLPASAPNKPNARVITAMDRDHFKQVFHTVLCGELWG
eukprot:TRINITY_DN16979_c0_g1_i1.p1 TRINITY_DN16979_c0_g1~~TRINITY_DN16979_c0_g1_i1.p1  ORF type:complete len:377 (-),score=90.72 TRINITY_DN16979_c0_g1_i1:63-1193(-)